MNCDEMNEVHTIFSCSQGIKAIKLYAWEKPYVKKIEELRREELKELKRIGILQAVNRMFFSSGPILIALAGFGVYTAVGGSLSASVAFPALALFQLLRFPVMMFPNQITNLINGAVALKRLQSFMESDEMDQAPPGMKPEYFHGYKSYLALIYLLLLLEQLGVLHY